MKGLMVGRGMEQAEFAGLELIISRVEKFGMGEGDDSR